MPVKKRISKSNALDEYKIAELHDGPASCLFNGLGYLAPFGDGAWHDKSKAIQEQVLTAMRADWERHKSKVMAAWHGRTDIKPEQGQPWALTEFS